MAAQNERFTPRRIRQERRDGTVKYRQLMIPVDEAMREHRQMLHLLYALDLPMPHATAAIRGRRLLDNVTPHRHNRHFYKVDIKDAFPSVDKAELVRAASRPPVPARHQAELKTFIETQATSRDAPGLPLGAPASPFLFNLYCLSMDRRLGSYCEGQGITYTRYLDDLTFSDRDKIGKRRRAQIREMIERTPGMLVNHAKSAVLTTDFGPVTITGASIYPSGRIGPSPDLVEAARDSFQGVQQIVSGGSQPDETDIGRLHGYHGAIHQLASNETSLLRWLDNEYIAALGTLGIAPPASAQ